jgi:hypothetical protein
MTQLKVAGLETTREILLDLLDQEISHAYSEEQRGGWTLWAVGGALSAAALLLLTTWEAGAFSVRTTAKWVLVIGLPVDLAVNYLWTWTDASRDTRRTYRYLREREHQQIALAWRALHFLTLLSIAVWVSEDVFRPAAWFVIGWYALLSITGIVITPFLAAELPYLQKPWIFEKGAVVFGSLLCVVMAGSMYAYVQTLPSLQPGTRTAELKVALLLITASYLFFRLLLGLRQPWQVRRLVTIRRELALGQMDLPTAARTAQMTLLGGGAQLALEEHLRKTAALHAEAKECSVRAQSLVEEFTREWSALQQEWSQLTPAERQKRYDRADGSLDTIQEATKDLRKWITRVQRRQSDFSKLYGRLQRESPASFAEGQETVGALYHSLQPEVDHVATVAESTESTLNILREQWRNQRRRKNPAK